MATLPAWFISLHFIGRAWGAGIRDALPRRFYGAVLASAAITGVAVWSVLGRLSTSPGLRMAIGASMYVSIYALVARLSRLLDDDDLRFVVRWFTVRLR